MRTKVLLEALIERKPVVNLEIMDTVIRVRGNDIHARDFQLQNRSGWTLTIIIHVYLFISHMPCDEYIFMRCIGNICIFINCTYAGIMSTHVELTKQLLTVFTINVICMLEISFAQ